MDLELTAEQHELRSLAAELLARRVPPSVPRAFLDGTGDVSALWDDQAELGWYGAFSCYKYSAVYAYNRMLHRRGKRIDPFNDGLEPLIERLLSQGLTILRGDDRMGSAAGGEGG